MAFSAKDIRISASLFTRRIFIYSRRIRHPGEPAEATTPRSALAGLVRIHSEHKTGSDSPLLRAVLSAGAQLITLYFFINKVNYFAFYIKYLLAVFSSNFRRIKVELTLTIKYYIKIYKQYASKRPLHSFNRELSYL